MPLIADLLARRQAVYEEADAVVDTDARTPEAVAAAVVALVRAWDVVASPQRREVAA